jgi:hypothetical protein
VVINHEEETAMLHAVYYNNNKIVFFDINPVQPMGSDSNRRKWDKTRSPRKARNELQTDIMLMQLALKKRSLDIKKLNAINQAFFKTKKMNIINHMTYTDAETIADIKLPF